MVGFSDGGLRKSSGKASIGWVVVAINDMGVWQLGSGGMAVDCGAAGSFSVEAIGLEVLVEKLVYLTTYDKGVDDATWMNSPRSYSSEQLATIQFCDV